MPRQLADSVARRRGLLHAPVVDNRGRRFARTVARLAVRSLHGELCLYPKPGLVSLVDNGSHTDMDAGTFMRSLFALRHYFRRICLAGMDAAPFAKLRALGIDAEAAMMAATGGVNTHRGAIFSLGLLCAAAGRAHAQRAGPDPDTLRVTLRACWGGELAQHAAAIQAAGQPASHGQRVAGLHAASGAREEGALGLPSVFEVALPAMHASLARGGSARLACIDTLFALMAHISDTNVYHRAGPQGAAIVRTEARRFLALGGTSHPGWQTRAEACHRLYVRHGLSPGGAADLLAAACLVQALTAMDAAGTDS